MTADERADLLARATEHRGRPAWTEDGRPRTELRQPLIGKAETRMLALRRRLAHCPEETKGAGWHAVWMQQAFGVAVPETVAEMCSPGVAAVLVYDVQVGILAHVRDREPLVQRIRSVIRAARQVSVPVVYVRHVSVPTTHMGVGALRAAMAWQRTQSATDVRPAFPPEAPQTQLVHDLAPEGAEPVFEKLGMSAFVGTPLEMLLRDRRLTTVILVGAVLEIGIEPTARHAADLGFLPVVVDDACGIVEPEAASRSLASLDYSLLSYRATSEEVIGALVG